jgi:hypothetical protein
MEHLYNYDWLISWLLKKNTISSENIILVKEKVSKDGVIDINLLEALYIPLKDKVIQCFSTLIQDFIDDEFSTREHKINDFLYLSNNTKIYIQLYKDVIWKCMSEEEIIISFLYLKLCIIEKKDIKDEEKYFISILMDTVYNLDKYLIKVKCQTCNNMILKNQIKKNLTLVGNYVSPYSCRNCKNRYLSIRNSIYDSLDNSKINNFSSFSFELKKSIDSFIEKETPNETDKNILSLMYKSAINCDEEE